MKNLITLYLFVSVFITGFSQNIDLYGLWFDQDSIVFDTLIIPDYTGYGFDTIFIQGEITGDQYLVNLNEITGQKTNVGILQGVEAVAFGSSTFDQSASSYIFWGVESSSSDIKLYNVSTSDASIINSPILTSQPVELKYDLQNSILYGLQFEQTGQNFDTIIVVNDTILIPGLPIGDEYLVTLDLQTGASSQVGIINGVESVVVSGSAINSNDGTFYFVGIDTNNIKRLYTIDLTDASIINNPVIQSDLNVFELEYDNSNDRLFATLTEINNNFNSSLIEIDPVDASYTTISDLNFPSGKVEGFELATSVFDQNSKSYIFIGRNVFFERRLYTFNTDSLTLTADPVLTENIIELEVDNREFARLFYRISTWTGVQDNNWHNALNWEDLQIPGADAFVTIPAGTPFHPVVSNNAAVRFLTIDKNAVFIVDQGVVFDVNGN